MIKSDLSQIDDLIRIDRTFLNEVNGNVLKMNIIMKTYLKRFRVKMDFYTFMKEMKRWIYSLFSSGR